MATAKKSRAHLRWLRKAKTSLFAALLFAVLALVDKAAAQESGDFNVQTSLNFSDRSRKAGLAEQSWKLPLTVNIFWRSYLNTHLDLFVLEKTGGRAWQLSDTAGGFSATYPLPIGLNGTFDYTARASEDRDTGSKKLKQQFTFEVAREIGNHATVTVDVGDFVTTTETLPISRVRTHSIFWAAVLEYAFGDDGNVTLESELDYTPPSHGDPRDVYTVISVNLPLWTAVSAKTVVWSLALGGNIGLAAASSRAGAFVSLRYARTTTPPEKLPR